MYIFFLFSLVIHTLFLCYEGHPKFQRPLERQIKVDLVALKSPSPQRPLENNPQSKNIPRPYIRSERIPQPLSQVSQQLPQAPQTQKVKIPTEYHDPKPLFSSSHAMTPPPKPLSNTIDANTYANTTDMNTIDQIASAAAGRGKEIFFFHHLPMKINAKTDRFDSDLALQGYQQALRRHIEHYKKFPSQASAKGWEGIVSVRFLLRRDGQMEQVRVNRSSAIALLDEAAIQAVKDGNPFPLFPESIRESSLWFEVPLVFELREKSN